MTMAGKERGIDRRTVVARHTVEMTTMDGTSPLSVGNGELCYTVDVTGLQTFPDRYPVETGGDAPGTLLGTMAQWGWHSVPGAGKYDLAETRRSYATPRGPVPYVDMRGRVDGTVESGSSAAETWLRANPHRLDLARMGLVLDGRQPDPATLTDIDQRLDLWSGIITSRYRLDGVPVQVTTACHPTIDAIAVRIESPLLDAGLAIRIAFPYGSESWNDAADWSRPEAHSSTVSATDRGCTVRRVLDATVYTVVIDTGPAGAVRQTAAHELVVAADGPALEVVVSFGSGTLRTVPAFDDVVTGSRRHWARFWSTGGAIDLAGSSDPRAVELERRIVLSQYLTAIHCAGSLPPQETGLMVNSWRGRFHLEMHWWHGAHFPLWGRAELLERSLGWYSTILGAAQQTARLQGYRGARWPKQVGPDGRESPSTIGPFLIWQQPHPIFLAELVRRGTRTPDVLHRYAEVVLESAAFMADFAVAGPDGYQLGPPLVPAQESYEAVRERLVNPTFELAYWAWALRVAQHWRRLLGLPAEPLWDSVADRIARPHVASGRYSAVGVPPYTVEDDHPSMLYALGVVPPTGIIDPATMRATLRHVLGTWDWETTWGWDYPAIAMTATRLGEPELAVDALLMPAAKNTYLPNGHNRQTPKLPIYLPGNGGLLAAIALMARGSDSDAGGPAPGFPKEGRWQVRHEGLYPMP